MYLCQGYDKGACSLQAPVEVDGADESLKSISYDILVYSAKQLTTSESRSSLSVKHGVHQM